MHRFVFRPAHTERPEERAALNPLKPAGTKLRWTTYRTNFILRLRLPSAQRESELSTNPSRAGLPDEQKGRRATSPPRKMTLALDNGVQRPITGLQIGSALAEAVRRVAHLSGVPLRSPNPDARTACFRRKRPSRTSFLIAISVPNINPHRFNTIGSNSPFMPSKKRRAGPVRSQLWETFP